MLLQSPTLRAVPGLVHGFTSAVTLGASDLGLGAPEGAWEAAAVAVGAPGAVVARMSQVHGRGVLRALGPGMVGEADALVTDVPGLLLAVRVADCVPILVLGERGVAAIHAGWRGLALGVIFAALDELGPGRAAVIGPCISAESYEVGDEVIDGILGAGVPGDAFIVVGPRRAHADLRAAAAWQLRAAGVASVEAIGPCTFIDTRLHSFRRDGARSGRQAGLIGWQA